MFKKPVDPDLDLIRYTVVTDKSTQLFNLNKYTFLVNPKSSKPRIKKAIEFLFDVKVEKVNTCHLPKTAIRVGKLKGTAPHYKKAIVKLKPGYQINYFNEN